MIAQDSGEEKESKQSSSFSPYWFLQGEIGPTFSHTVVSKYGFAPDFSRLNFNGALAFGRQLSPVFDAYAKIERGFFEGEKDNVPSQILVNAPFGQDLNFKSDYFAGNLNVGINLSNLISGYNDRLVDIGLHLGFGMAHWQSYVYDNNTGLEVARPGHKNSAGVNTGGSGNGINDRNVDFIVPVGFDVTFNVSDKWDIYGDYSYNYMDTDYADGVIKGAMQVKNDVYSYFNIGARYKFGKSNVKGMASDFGKVELQVIPEVLEEKGDSVIVTIKGNFPPKYFKKNAVMNFTPVLTYEGGATAFEPITFKGESVSGDGTLISYQNGGSFTYTGKVPYNPDMNVSELVVAPLIYANKGTVYTTREQVMENTNYYMADERKLADGVIYTSKRIEDNLSNSVMPHGYEKVTIVTQSADLFFQVNLANLNWNLPMNKKQESKDALAAMTTDVLKGWELKDITIDGWASPEGEETFNQGLSGRRAKTTVDFVKRELDKLAKKHKNELAFNKANEITFVETANGPDWNGFMSAVEASNLKDKNSILNVVRSASADQREQEIRNMILIYPEIEADILPPLRRAIINVNTFEPKHTDAEIAEMAISDPAALKLNELLYAATLTEDMNTRKAIYASAMDLHPKCLRAVVNASEVELQMGNVAEAKRLLQKAAGMTDKSAEVHNNLAVVAVMERDFATAEMHLNKAKALGGDVNYNMGIVNIYKGDYAKAVSLMQGEKCDYNLGLAQLLNKDYSAAKNTLGCAPETAEGFYLMAVASARTDDASAVYTNLIKAIQKDENYKNTAKWDREFMKYYSEPDFQNIVQ
jgi:outer membrane protein OmpA-like peptidoglycan-associated protein